LFVSCLLEIRWPHQRSTGEIDWPYRSAPIPSIFMEMVINHFGDLFGNSFHGHQIRDRGAADGLRGAEMQEQRTLATRPDATDLVEGILHQFVLAAGAVGAD